MCSLGLILNPLNELPDVLQASADETMAEAHVSHLKSSFPFQLSKEAALTQAYPEVTIKSPSMRACALAAILNPVDDDSVKMMDLVDSPFPYVLGSLSYELHLSPNGIRSELEFSNASSMSNISSIRSSSPATSDTVSLPYLDNCLKPNLSQAVDVPMDVEEYDPNAPSPLDEIYVPSEKDSKARQPDPIGTPAKIGALKPWRLGSAPALATTHFPEEHVCNNTFTFIQPESNSCDSSSLYTSTSALAFPPGSASAMEDSTYDELRYHLGHAYKAAQQYDLRRAAYYIDKAREGVLASISLGCSEHSFDSKSDTDFESKVEDAADGDSYSYPEEEFDANMDDMELDFPLYGETCSIIAWSKGVTRPPFSRT